MVASAVRAVVCSAAVSVLVTTSVLHPTGAEARSCDDLTGLVTVAAANRTEALLALPQRLVGRRLPTGTVTVSQGWRDVPVTALDRQPRSLVDVVVVVDSSARAARHAGLVRRATRALLARLPRTATAGLVLTGADPPVVRWLAPGPKSASRAVERVQFTGPAPLIDAVAAAVGGLSLGVRRQQHVVVVGAGPDSGSRQTWPDVARQIQRRGVALDVIDVTARRSLPGAGEQCPDGLDEAKPAVAAATVAESILDGRRLVMPEVDGAVPLFVTVAHKGLVASTTLQRRGDVGFTTAESRRPTATSSDSPAPFLTYALAFLALVLVLVASVARRRVDRAGRAARWLAVKAGLPRHRRLKRTLSPYRVGPAMGATLARWRVVHLGEEPPVAAARAEAESHVDGYREAIVRVGLQVRERTARLVRKGISWTRGLMRWSGAEGASDPAPRSAQTGRPDPAESVPGDVLLDLRAADQAVAVGDTQEVGPAQSTVSVVGPERPVLRVVGPVGSESSADVRAVAPRVPPRQPWSDPTAAGGPDPTPGSAAEHAQDPSTTAAEAASTPGGDRLVRVAAVLPLPVALGTKLQIDAGWWSDLDWPRATMLVLAVLLAAAGSLWIWRATRPPRALTARHAAAVRAARTREADQIRHAAVVLARLTQDGSHERAWRDFEVASGLTVAGPTRSVVDAEMDPAALVRYLAARQRESFPQPHSLPFVVVPPTLLCLVPAVVLAVLV